jgi:hypothetical protein
MVNRESWGRPITKLKAAEILSTPFDIDARQVFEQTSDRKINKTFFFVTNTLLKQAQVFVSCKLFAPKSNIWV